MPELFPNPLQALLREARLETIEIFQESQASGKLIRELELRSKTGASAVGIERANESIVNPGPDEEIHAGDRLLLLGHPAQIEAAKTLLSLRK